ncbi:MAG: LysR family transcriptional regulator [Peptococcaceae bacterium]|nr:LysR family transcriptional regulator [Peptococcaceae bacterium]
MRFEQLEYLIAITETGSMTNAANLLYTSRQNISKEIISLENELGEPLFLRDKKSMILTSAGKRLYWYSKKIIDLKKNLLSEFNDNSSNFFSENLNIITTPALLGPLSIIQEGFREKNKHVKIRVFSKENSYVESVIQQDENAYDLMFGLCEKAEYNHLLEKINNQYNIFSLGEATLEVMMSKDMNFLQSSVVSIKDLSKKPLMVLQESIEEENFYLECLLKRGFDEINIIRTGSMEIYSEKLKKGKSAVLILSTHKNEYENALERDEYKYVSISPEISIIKFVLIKSNGSEISKRFLEYYLSVFG